MSCLPGSADASPVRSAQEAGSSMAAATASTYLVGGIDPHADTIHVAVVTAVGKPIARRRVPHRP